MDEELEDGEHGEFYEAVREYVISFLVFIVLYCICFVIVQKYRQKRDESDSDEDEAWVYRIALWLCTLTLAVSLGAVLLLPVTIISNEILLSYPKSYYVKWLNGSLIHGLWNNIFLGTNVSLFATMPFAYFFTESEGFAGLKKGIRAKVYETAVVLFLLAVLVGILIWVGKGIFGQELSLSTSFGEDGWIPYLPFLYSLISLLGVLMLLICTPMGLARMFTVLGQYVVKPEFLRDLDNEISAINLEEENIRRKLNGVDTSNGLTHRSLPVKERLNDLRMMRKELERRRDASPWQRNLVYPVCLLVLVALTAISMAMVALNFLNLLFVDGSLPTRATELVLGQVSFSKMGTFGALVEILIIAYFMVASIVGLYSAPVLVKLRPSKTSTPMTKVIANCIVLLILSSALPVLSRILGITKFDLLGEFGRLNWLGNLKIVLLYNMWFEAVTAFCLFNKFTATVRKALFEQVKLSPLLLSGTFLTRSNASP